MINISEYADLIKLLLGEAAKYFFLLLFSVLAIRLWRQVPKSSAGGRWKSFSTACVASVAACGVGYFSICHSLSLLYSHYGMQAFTSGNIPQAASLFETSRAYWRSADALGENGVCMLWLGNADEGIRMLDEAKAVRNGRNTSFEEYYEGLYYFFHGQSDRASPLLESASGDPLYQWNITKLFAVIQLDAGRPDEAERLMKPFAQAEVADYDHAYINASLDLHEGKKAEAVALADKFDSKNLPPFWKSRFDKLREKIQEQTP